MGYASFVVDSALDYSPGLRWKAKDVGADIVLVAASNAGTESGVAPLINYQPGQTSTTYQSGRVNATASSSNGTSAWGTAQFSGQSTTTTSGSYSTSYVPYTRNLQKSVASFWRKRRSAEFVRADNYNSKNINAIGRTERIPENYHEGSVWYAKAASQGRELVQYTFRDKYGFNISERSEIVLAHVWCSFSFGSGSGVDGVELMKLEKEMTFDQKTEAMMLARELFAKLPKGK